MSDDFYRADEDYDVNESPLANRMRPTTIDEVVGQEHILGKGKILRRMIEADMLSSIIFWGPPGTGKTSLAHVIANTTENNFVQINATTSGKKEMEEIIADAKKVKMNTGEKTVLFIDEIHRFNKAQQDFLLPFVEKGVIILIGATTENPYFEVNKALLSRSNLFELQPLSKENLKELLNKAVTDHSRGVLQHNVIIDEDVIDFFADVAGSDARMALNALELAVRTTEKNNEGKIHINLEIAENCIQQRTVRYDKNGTNHYDTISAFIKSVRGSDPDAAIYYLASMLNAGEDIKFIARRLIILASEDIGNADPMALVVATSAAQAVMQIGMPESQLILSQTTLYLASAPKSNACTIAIGGACEAVEKTAIKTIPPHLQDAHYGDASKIGRGTGYLYPHNYPGHYVKQQYLPDELVGSVFYSPTDIGYEKKIKNNLDNHNSEHK